MQLTGPIFLLLFLPLSLLPVLWIRRYRAVVLSALGALWYLLVNYRNIFGILLIFSLVFLVALLCRFSQKKIVPVLTIFVSSGLLVALRLLAEYAKLGAIYPMGLTIVTMGIVSLMLDLRRGRVETPDVFEVVAYLLFFPVLTMGPILGFASFQKLCKNAEVTPARMSYGIHVYLDGYVRRLVFAAPLLRSLEEIFSHDPARVPFLMLLFAMLLAFFLLYFFLTGTTAMARGIANMYGLYVTADYDPLLTNVYPNDMPMGMLNSLRDFLRDYIETPLRTRIGGRGGRTIAATVGVVLFVLFFRLRADALLLALPMILFTALQAFFGRPTRPPRNIFARIGATLLSVLSCSIMALSFVLPEPMRFFEYLVGNFDMRDSYNFYYIYGALSGAHYLPYLIVIAAVFILLSHLIRFWQPRRTERFDFHLHVFETVLLFIAFAFTFRYFMPQFPSYATTAITRLYI